MSVRKRTFDDAVMSDRTLLVSVEDLIYTAFGTRSGNTVNFKLLQTILHILARQLRLLEQDVEIKFDEIETALGREAGHDDGYDDESETYSSTSTEGEEGGEGAERRRKRDERRERRDRARIEEKGDKKERRDKKERGEKGEKDEKDEKGGRKGRRGKGEKEDGKTSSKDREGKRRSKDRDEKDKSSRDKNKSSRGRDKSSRGRRSEDDGDEGGRERRQGRERAGKGADGRGGRGSETEDHDAQGQARVGLGKNFGRQTSGASITVSETTRRGSGGRGSADKILVAERGPAARVRSTRIGSIEVVTASEFALLGKKVKQLEQITGPLPAPVLPDNETLRQDLATGRASLQDTMQAVQLNARVQAAEQGLYRMAELLTQLAQSGKLPSEFTGQVGAMEAYLQAAMAAGYVAKGPDGTGADRSGVDGSDKGGRGKDGRGKDGPGKDGPGKDGSGKDGSGKDGPGKDGPGKGGPDKGGSGKGGSGKGGPGKSATGVGGKASTMSRMSRMDSKKSTATVATDAEAPVMEGVTHNEMYEVLQHMKDALFREISKMTARANHSADMASSTSRNVAEKLDIAMQIDERVTTLFQQAADYAEQLNGFDSGVTIQVQSFQDQLVMMRNDLAGGLALLEAANNNAETAALLDLTERHQGLVIELDNTFHLHQNLHVTQHQIGDELRSMIKCVEMLREQKADRDEVLDGLRDKADISRLAGLLYEKDFARARFEIEKRISKCYEVFNRQDVKWQDALKELMAIADNKAEIVMLMSLKDATNAELHDIHEQLRKLEIMLGEPKAAILMRQLAKDAACGVCLTRALMEPQDATYGKPLPLAALRPPPLGAERRPCFGEVKLAPPDIRDHTCNRWVGGSHTLMGNIVKEKAGYKHLQIIPTKKFGGYGIDGKMYMMEEDMQRCAECNKLSTDEPGQVPIYLPAPDGAGDQALAPLAL